MSELFDDFLQVVAYGDRKKMICILHDNTLLLSKKLSNDIKIKGYSLYSMLSCTWINNENILEYLNSINNAKSVYYTYIGYIILLENGNVLFLFLNGGYEDIFIEHGLPILSNIANESEHVESIKVSVNCFALKTNTNNIYVLFNDNCSNNCINDYTVTYSECVVLACKEKSKIPENIENTTPTIKNFNVGVLICSIQQYFVCTSSVFVIYNNLLYMYNIYSHSILQIPYIISNIKNIFSLEYNIYIYN